MAVDRDSETPAERKLERPHPVTASNDPRADSDGDRLADEDEMVPVVSVGELCETGG